MPSLTFAPRAVPQARTPAAPALAPRPAFPMAPAAPATASGGAAIPDPVRRKMEAALGHDFASVRIHHDASAAAIGAHAYTRGEHVHFAPGRFRPQSSRGQELLGHELAHVAHPVAAAAAAAAPLRLPVNSVHWAVNEFPDAPAAGGIHSIHTTARSSDAAAHPEAFEDPGRHYFMGVQWHPEYAQQGLAAGPAGAAPAVRAVGAQRNERLMRSLGQAAVEGEAARRIQRSWRRVRATRRRAAAAARRAASS